MQSRVSQFTTVLTAVILLPAVFFTFLDAQAQSVRTEKNFRDAIVTGTMGNAPIDSLEFDFLDMNSDGRIDVQDMIQYLIDAASRVPTVSFSERRYVVNEGQETLARVEFSREFNGTLKVLLLSHDGSRGTNSAIEGNDFSIGSDGIDETTGEGKVLSYECNDCTSVDIPIQVLDDVEFEPGERIELELEGSDEYIREGPAYAFIFIRDNDAVWHGSIQRDNLDALDGFSLRITQFGDTFTGEIAVDGLKGNLFGVDDNGAPVNFSGTSVAANLFRATIVNASNSSATKFRANFSRAFTFAAGEGIVLANTGDGSEPIPSEFDRHRVITGRVTIVPDVDTPAFASLVGEPVEGDFALVKEISIPGFVLEAIGQGEEGSS